MAPRSAETRHVRRREVVQLSFWHKTEIERREAIPGHVIHIPPGVLNMERLPDLVRYIEGQVGTSVQVATLSPSVPPWLFAKLNKEFGFTVDVCASDQNAKCKRYWTKEQDSKQQDWSNEVCWMNPPYDQDLGDWIHKAYRESLKGATVVCLITVSPDRSWWHDYVIDGNGEIRWIRQTTATPFPRCIVIFRPPGPPKGSKQ